MEKGEERKERWKKEGEMEGCVGGFYHYKWSHLSPGAICSPSLKGDSHLLCLSRCSSQRPLRREKREDRSLNSLTYV